MSRSVREEKLLKYNLQVPRYTSYPTAPHFEPVTSDAYSRVLEGLPHGLNASIYIHIPYCNQMCWYCGCHTTATRKYSPIEEYLSILTAEITAVTRILAKRLPVSHLHFGGGSPSILQPDDFRRIMGTLKACFDFSPDAEICVEADPRGFLPDKAKAYKDSGVNRISFGVQDFTAEVQHAINRMQSYSTVERSIGVTRDAGIDRINLDLMYGLPKQTVGNVEDTISKSMGLAPDRISFFGYAHVPWMKKHMRLIDDGDLPDAAARIRQFLTAEERIAGFGLIPIGIDHFVRSGDELHRSYLERKLARNFQGYTTDRAQILLGFGMSSISKLPSGYFQNSANVTEYTAAITENRLPVYRGRYLTDEDRLRADIISDLMCYFEVDIAEMSKKYNKGPRIFAGILEGMEDLRQDGIVANDVSRIRVNPSMRQAVRVVASRFDEFFQQNTKRHSQAV